MYVWAIRLTPCFVYRRRPGSDEAAKAEAAAEAYVEVRLFYCLSYWQLDTDVVLTLTAAAIGPSS